MKDKRERILQMVARERAWRFVGRPPKNVDLSAFLQGHEAAKRDLETGGLADCPCKTRISKRDWWRGYHCAERVLLAI